MTAVLTRMMGLMVSGLLLATPQTVPSVLSGTVTHAGRGQAGVTVRAFPAGGSTAAAATTTAADGAYTLTLPRGVYRVVFTAEGFDAAIRTGMVILPGSASELNLSLVRTGTSQTSETVPDLRSGEVGVKIETRFGYILLAIDQARAPITAGNFLTYVDAGLYNNGRFHRATRPDNYTPVLPNRPMMELIQGGINPERKSEGFPPIPLERTTVTGLRHVAGTVSMARGTAADTATSDFFILLDDQPSLDAGGRRFDDEQGAAAFGRVLFGLGVVRRIQQAPVQGQNLTPPVLMIRVSRY